MMQAEIIESFPLQGKIVDPPIIGRIEEALTNQVNEEVVKFISEQVDVTGNKILFLSSGYSEKKIDLDNLRTIVDLKKLNHRKDINSYFRSMNEKLPDAGIFIGCAESYTERKKRVQFASSKLLNAVLWATDFIVNRVFPKMPITKNIYHFFSRGKYHVMSKAEILGRLSYAGFEIIDHKTIDNLLYYSSIKTKEPKNDKNPSYGIMFKMNRISKNGKMIGIYKVRTMHPYSEYIQDYVVRLNGYNEVGKPARDFRLTSWSKVIRKLHLDEMPQLINFLKGDLSIVGVRPLSQFGYSALPLDLQEERIKYKPGCIPPNVALKMTGFNGVIEAERIYLKELKKSGYLTNFKYFWMALYNIVTRKSSSA